MPGASGAASISVMARIVWKGAISFGLVHVPVALYPASQEAGIDFDWLDKRSLDPVGYQRINKRTGKPIDNDDVVKGLRQGDGEYVVLSEDEIKAAFPKSTQTIEIESFARAAELSYALLEKPYFIAPQGKADKVYSLLREAMREAGVIGIARVVMHAKEHLAALIADERALMLNTIRWSAELRAPEDIAFPPAGKDRLTKPELDMARQLVGQLTTRFDPSGHADRFTDAIHKLAAARVKAGRTETVTPLEDEAAPADNVVDLTALLKQSLGARPAPAAKVEKKAVATKAATKAAKKAAKKAVKKAPTKPARNAAKKAPLRRAA